MIAGDWHGNTKYAIRAVEHAKNTPFDIIFMDIQMPILDGVSALTRFSIFDY